MNIILLFSLLTFFLNPLDQNDSYIEKEVSNLNEQVKNGKFENGFILVKGDTIKTEILRFKRRKNKNSYLFCVAKVNADSLKVYTARQIEGYAIGNDTYRSQPAGETRFFIRLLKSGKATLFERDGIPSDRRFLYYMKLPKYANFFIICPDGQNVEATIIPPNKESAGMISIDSKNIPEKFKMFVSTYLGDCVSLRNMVQSNFYSINDIPTIIDIYNKCADK
jgi:hypothetical protein